MWSIPKRDLKLRLTLQIAGVAVVCLMAAVAYTLFAADRATRDRIANAAGIAARTLSLQQEQMAWIKGTPLPFPDLQVVAAPLVEPGLCIAYRADGGTALERICGGTQATATAPAVFVAFYEALFAPGQEIARPVQFRGQRVGEAVAWADPATITAQAWQTTSRLFTVMAATLLLLCVLVYVALARALRPTRIIRTGLERIAAQDLTARLPPFDLAELSAIRDVFNGLAGDLERTLGERNALTRKLIDVQDEERRHLARELHDEFGQNLTAIRALAASIGQTATRQCPELLAECASIERTASRMMETLRGALVRLRPPDVDELGLAASLDGLVAGWNGRARGRTRFALALTGPIETVPATIGTSLYRIAQEAITNAARHAEAQRVTLDLVVEDVREIRLTVTDDGRAAACDTAPTPGMGILGMRERVAALGGTLMMESQPAGGTVLKVAIPFADQREQAA